MLLNKVYQGIDVPKTMQFSISRDNFSIRARCCPRKITKNVAYVVIVLRSTYFAMLNVCWIEWWKECRSLQIPNLCVTQRFLFFLDSQCKLGISIAWFTVKELWHKKWNRGINLTSIEFTTQVSTDRFRLKLLVMRHLTSRELSSIGLEQTQNMNFALSKIGFSFIQRFVRS